MIHLGLLNKMFKISGHKFQELISHLQKADLDWGQYGTAPSQRELLEELCLKEVESSLIFCA